MYCFRNVFRYVANGLDVYRSSAPNVVDNTFFNLALPGLNGTLAYDIQKGTWMRFITGEKKGLVEEKVFTWVQNKFLHIFF